MSITLKTQEFMGRVLPDMDPKRQGRYKVHIPELMPHEKKENGIFCKNQVHKFRLTNSEKGDYGQYFPLQPGTKVIVRFFDDDLNTAYVDRVISDNVHGACTSSQDANESINTLEDRDNHYMLLKTPANGVIMYVNEKTEKEPNTFYLIFNRDGNPQRRTVLRIDESGISWFTRDNRRVRIKTDDNLQVDGNQTEYVKGYRTHHVDGDDDLKVTGNSTTKIIGNIDFSINGNGSVSISGNTSININGNCNIKVSGETNLDASKINLNCGKANPTPPVAVKPHTTVRDLGPGETPEYQTSDGMDNGRPKVVGNKCDKASNKPNASGHRETLVE